METGHIGRQASASVTVTDGETVSAISHLFYNVHVAFSGYVLFHNMPSSILHRTSEPLEFLWLKYTTITSIFRLNINLIVFYLVVLFFPVYNYCSLQMAPDIHLFANKTPGSCVLDRVPIFLLLFSNAPSC